MLQQDGAEHGAPSNDAALDRFCDLISRGAGTLDKHDEQESSSPYVRPVRAPRHLVEREVGRVNVHLRSLCSLLAEHVGPVGDILDVGCGTGATSVAMALCPELDPKHVIGVDPNDSSLEAARARADCYSLKNGTLEFEPIHHDAPLPFQTDRFGLTVCVSVLEYIGSVQARAKFAGELLRVTRPGGTVCLVTPNPLRLRDYHTHRMAGDWRRTPGYPWASPPWQLRRFFAPHKTRFLLTEQLALGLRRRNIPGASLASRLRVAGWFLPWQKVLVAKNQ